MKVGFFGLLFLLFLALKLTHMITWSWWIVFGPLWMPIAAFVLFVGLIGTGAVIVKTQRGTL